MGKIYDVKVRCLPKLNLVDFGHLLNIRLFIWSTGTVIVVQRQLSNFSAISLWEQVNFQWDDDEVLYTNTLSWIFLVLVHWNNSLRVETLFHSDILSSFCSGSLILCA